MTVTANQVLRPRAPQIERITDLRAKVVIEPLEPGFGYTLGNSLRRTLLSSIPGAAVTSIKIEGVDHEFSTIEGVTEDVTEIILNLKELVVSSEHDEPVSMYLQRQGPGVVTAGDIEPPAGVEVHTPELVIATLNDNGYLKIDLVVERGRGYVSAALNKEAVEIAVSDTGIGIAPENHQTIFEEFRQVGTDAAKKREGTGLGLTLTKKFVELHGGSIRVDSAVGKGSTFTFTLPLN